MTLPCPHFATAMVERWGGKAYLHVYVVFPPAGQQNVFFVKRDGLRFGRRRHQA